MLAEKIFPPLLPHVFCGADNCPATLAVFMNHQKFHLFHRVFLIISSTVNPPSVNSAKVQIAFSLIRWTQATANFF
jgi:hypothetical protein